MRRRNRNSLYRLAAIVIEQATSWLNAARIVLERRAEGQHKRAPVITGWLHAIGRLNELLHRVATVMHFSSHILRIQRLQKVILLLVER